MFDPRPITESEVRAAAERIRHVLVPTPLLPLRWGRGRGGDDDRARDVWLKPELLQSIGSFKIRGVYHAVARMDPEARSAGLETVSAGNTARALAFAAGSFGVEARSIMPEHAPATKVEAMRALGGTPVLVPTPEVFRFLREELWNDDPYAFVHPWLDRDLWTGHGTLALELLEERPDVETVFVPLGGGGLLAGVAGTLRALAPHVRIVAVEPAGCPSYSEAVRAGRPVDVACSTICDGVAVPYVTDELFGILDRLVDEVMLVTEDEVFEAIRGLAFEDKLVVEGAGALAAAAALRSPYGERGRSIALVTGGCIDRDKLRSILFG